MKHQKLFFASLLASAVLFTGCPNPDPVNPCESVTCQNGGTCIDGSCDCPSGYTGTNCETKIFAIGDSYGGGIIFHIDATGQHGLIAASNDQSSTAIWGCEGTDIPSAANKNVGAGQSNTTAIINGCVGPNATNTAAKICDDLSSNGFNDWFLPSSDELDLLYKQRNTIGGFAAEIYWSSSQSDANSGWRHNFVTNARGGHLKSIQNRVRAIRAF